MSCSKDDKIKELEAQIDSLKTQNTERSILPSEQPIPIGQEITVTGIISSETEYDGEESTTFIALNLDTPLDFIATEKVDFLPKGHIESNVTRMHIWGASFDDTNQFINKKVKITGTTFEQHTGHHMTPILLSINSKDDIILLENYSGAQSNNTNQIDIQNAEQIAIQFINTYTDTDEFPNNLVTDNFSKLYKKWRSSDFIEYNRIVNGQDNGTKYKLSKILKTEGDSAYLLLTATQDWVGYKITIKVTKANGKWLVDGSGDLNIPKSLVAKN